MQEDASDRENRKVLVWDVPTRVFHWLAVALVVGAYATARMNWMDWHARAGYALLAALLFRLLWGVTGGQTARFASFLSSPRAAARHLAQLFRRERDLQIGHNPAGGWMVVALLALMLAQTLSGLYVQNDIADEGPLTEIVPAPLANLVEDAHDRWLWDALIVAVAIHLAAIAIHALVKRQNLVGPMISGRKRLPAATPAPAMQGATRALLALACSLAVVIALVRFV
jgi:cytochrome b